MSCQTETACHVAMVEILLYTMYIVHSHLDLDAFTVQKKLILQNIEIVTTLPAVK